MSKKTYPLATTPAHDAATADVTAQAQQNEAMKAGKTAADEAFALTLTGGNIAADNSVSIFNRLDKTVVKKLTLPPMILPGQLPVGAEIVAEIIDAVKSPVSTVKGKLFVLKSIPGDQEYCFPATGVLRSALLGSDSKDDDKDSLPKLQAFKGQILLLKKLPSKSNKHGGRDVHMFEVATCQSRAAFEKMLKK